MAPLATPVSTTAANWGSVRKFYIYTAQDNAVSPQLQQTMTGKTTFAATATLQSSHSPFLSQPTELTSALTKF
jgi:hypothetical protein